MSIRILTGDCRDVMRAMDAESVDCVVTSPPYWGLRDYGVPGQLGLEPTLAEHIAVMVDVFECARRVLKKTGTLWLNYGDSYAAQVNGRSAHDVKLKGNDDRTFRDKPFGTIGNGLKPKDLCMVPNRLAIALQDAGWWVRSEIIWAKPNPMPESVRDRPTSAHEKIWLLAKSGRYFYDAEAIAEEATRAGDIPGGNNHRGAGQFGVASHAPFNGTVPETRNRRNVWTIPSQPFSDAHFATFPPALIEPCIKAGSSEKGVCKACGKPWVREVERETNWPATRNGSLLNGNRNDLGAAERSSSTVAWQPSCRCHAGIVPATVLDPFGGAGTTGMVADRLGRNAILIELNAKYAAMAQARIVNDLPLFAEVTA